MPKIIKACFVLIYFAFLQVGIAYSQTIPQEKFIKWEGLSGKNNEFVIFMPAGYITTAVGESYMERSPTKANLIKRRINAARYVNGVILLMEYYDGSGKDIYKHLQKKEKLTLEKEEEVNSFQVRHFSAKSEKGYRKTIYYFNKESLYSIKVIAKSENEEIIKGFFESVRLVNQNITVAPNAPPDAKSTSLPNLIEQETSRLDDSLAILSTEADREPIILQSTNPNFSSEMRRGITNVRVKLKVLLSSSGKVTNVEALEINPIFLKEEAVQAAKKIIFIPAEKDGKLVSVYQTVEYKFSLVTR